jgi:multiple sugar transport system substrate-binding protein
MNAKKVLSFLSAVIILSMIIASCAPPSAVTNTPVAGETSVATTAPITAPTTAPITVPTTAPTTAPVEKVTLTFWHSYSEAEMKLMNETLIPAFEAKYPNVTVESVQIPYNEMRRKLITAIAGGTAPDLMRSDIIWVPEYADMGALVQLDQFMPDWQTYQDAVFPGPLSTNYLNGHYYGLPLDTNTRVLVTNTGMLTAAGITTPPTTMDEFMADCEKIKALGSDKYCFADGGTYAWAVNPWIWSFGGDVTDPAITVATGYLNGPKTKAAYEFLKELLDKGYMHPAILGGVGSVGVDVWGSFGNNEIAMILEGPWFPTIFGNKIEYNFSLMPAGPGGSISVTGGEDIIMFQQSQHKEDAANFLRFLLSEDSQLTMLTTGQIPVLNSLLTNNAITSSPYLPVFMEQLQTAKSRTPHPQFTKMEEIYTNAGGLYLRGEQTFDQAFTDAATQIDALLKPSQ